MKKISRYLCTLLFAAIVLALPSASFAGVFVGISVGIAPPPLPVYAQPVIPGPGYMWTPGYWAWGPGGYYWVPGTWVQPPTVGLLWTPGYWGWRGGVYAFNAGYWGPHIGFYGGVNYGYGYGGVGYEGGYWNHGVFAYNRSVNNISNVHVTNVYNKTVINNVTVNRASYNGGTGGIQARPTAQEEAALHEDHRQPTSAQVQHVNEAQNNPQLRAAVNGGKPAIAATSRPNDFKNAVPARQAGGEVNTAAYKAAAENGGKLPSNMKDPGGNANRPANSTTASVRPENRPGTNGESARSTSKDRPDAAKKPEPAAKPEAPAKPESAARPTTEARPAPAERSEAKPAPAERPEAKPAPAERPEAKPAPAERPAPSVKPESPRPEAKPKAEPKAEPKAHAEPKPEAKPKASAKPSSHPQQHSQSKKEGASHEEKPKD